MQAYQIPILFGSQPSVVLLSMQDRTEGEFFLLRLLSSTAEFNSLFGLSRIGSLRYAIFGNTAFIYDLRSRLWGVARLLGLRGIPPRLQPLLGVG